MKMNEETYSKLEHAISLVIAKFGPDKVLDCRQHIRYVNNQFVSFCWHIFAVSGLGWGILYKEGLDDSHIETALKKILKEYK